MASITLQIDQRTHQPGRHSIELRLKRPGKADRTARAEIEFAITPSQHNDLRWYLEDYLQQAESVTAEHVVQIEQMLRQRGEELYRLVLRANDDTVDLWAGIRDQLADVRVEIRTGVADAAAIPWELMFEPKSDSAIALRVQSFVRVQSDPNMGFVEPSSPDELGRVRLLYVVCRPNGIGDVELRAVVNQLLQELHKSDNLDRFDITALRPPTYERLQQVLADAKAAGRPFHIVHFDGHGTYEDLENTTLADWLKGLSLLTLGGPKKGKHGYLLFEHPETDEKLRPVSGDQLGKLLHDNGVPVLVLNACQSAMHDATAAPSDVGDMHDEVRAIGSLAQAVVDQGIPAVLGMRYSVFVVTAAQYIGQMYAALAKGRDFGQAASEGRKHLFQNPDRWIGLEPRPLQDWFVPVVYEAAPLTLFKSLTTAKAAKLREASRAAAARLDPVQTNPLLVKYVPDTDFIGRDETLLLLDRAFDAHRVVLLHAYAGQGKTTTAVEFARWYATTGGLSAQPNVLLTSFETVTTLNDVLDTIGQAAVEDWSALVKVEEKRQRVLGVLRSVPLLWIWDNVEPVAGFPEGTPSLWTDAEQRELAEFLKLIKLDKSSKAKLLLTSRRDEQTWLGHIPERIRMPKMRNRDAAHLARALGATKGRPPSEIHHWQPLLDYCAGNPLTLRVLVKQAVDMGLRGEPQIAAFVQAVRDGEQHIQDVDAAQGRDVSLGASLDYGFRHAFKADELPIIALLHLFQGVVDVRVLLAMGVEPFSLPELAAPVATRGSRVDPPPSDPTPPTPRTSDELKALLDRCSETGLLTPLGGTWYSIHPALPWFLSQLFARHYPANVAESLRDSAASSTNPQSPIPASTSLTALRAWSEAIGELANHYHRQFNEGNRGVIQLLQLEEPNLLQARRISRRHGWWSPVTSAMQGLHVLYEYQGRLAEWSRLVAEIVPDYCTATDCTATDEPIAGRETGYSLVMGYRVNLARDHHRDLTEAACLQEKVVAWDRQQAAPALAIPSDTPLDAAQRNLIRTLGASVFALGQIQREQGNRACVATYEDAVQFMQRIGDTAAEATAHYNIGHAYMQLPAIRDLDAAEAAYQRELTLLNPHDLSGRAGTIYQIGMVHHERFNEARAALNAAAASSGSTGATSRGTQALETEVLRHAQAAESHYLQALALCPATAITDLGPFHNQLGVLYKNVGQTEQAREHYERAAQYFAQSDNRHSAGTVRRNMALMYLNSASRESTASGREQLLRRARTYAEAALLDFQHYEGRAAADEADAQQLMADIDEQLQ